MESINENGCYVPTMQLRFIRKEDFKHDTKTKLQQMWVNTATGRTEWRNIETVIEPSK